jgi:hypothetical protein
MEMCAQNLCWQYRDADTDDLMEVYKDFQINNLEDLPDEKLLELAEEEL